MWKNRVSETKKENQKRETCLVDECNKEPRRSGFCKQHYTRWNRSGDPLILKREAGACAPGCTCSRHNAQRGVRVASLPCGACGRVSMVHPCYGPDGNHTRKFCNPTCWRKWQSDQVSIRRSAGDARAWDMPVDEFHRRLEAQENKCAICLKTITGRDIHRDHDHDTGEWRGLLCNNCNRGLGHFQDNPDLLASAAFYLLKNKNVIGVPGGDCR